MRRLTRIFSSLTVCLFFLHPALADDTDIYLNPTMSAGAKPLVMFTLDFRQNLSGPGCSGANCNTLINEGYLVGQASPGNYSKFDVLRAILKKVLAQVNNVQIGFMMTHEDDNNCPVPGPVGPAKAACSNGGFIPQGFGDVGNPAHLAAFHTKLGALPTPTNNNTAHFTQAREAYFELYRYLTGQAVVNAHNSGGDHSGPAPTPDVGVLTSDPAIQVGPGGVYLSPVVSQCTKTFTINFTYAKINFDGESNALIANSVATGGMGLTAPNNATAAFTQIVQYLNDVDLADGNHGVLANQPGRQNVISYFFADGSGMNDANQWAAAGGTGSAFSLDDDPDIIVANLSNIFKSILSVSTTFVSPSVPVNVFNRTQVVNEVFMALFDPDENAKPLWPGNLKKLRIGKNATTGKSEVQDANGVSAIDIDGRIKRDAVTFWTDVTSLPAPVNSEVAGADGRSVPRGGAGQKTPGFIAGGPGASNAAAGARQLFAIDTSDLVDGLMPLDTTATTAAALWPQITQNWSPAPAGTYAGASGADQSWALNILKFARGLNDDGVTPRPWWVGDPLHSQPLAINYGARDVVGGYDANNPDIRLVMGTNDGFMHMFRNTTPGATEDGGESWSVIPQEVIPVLDRLHANSPGTPVHPTGADGSPAVYTVDVNFDGSIISTDGDTAHIYFGLGRGGKSYYALDVIDPDAPKLLWTLSKVTPGFGELGQTWSKPQVGQVKVGSTVIPVVVFAGGYNGDDDGDDLGDLGKDATNRQTRASVAPSPGIDDDEGNAIYIVNATDGSLVWKATKGNSIGYNSSNKEFTHPGLVDSIPSSVSAIDTNADQFLDRIYVADTGGVVWRIDLAGMFDHDTNLATPKILVHNEPSVWTAGKLLSVGRHVSGFSTIVDDRRFFNRPDVVQSRDGIGPFDGVLIGSGDREDPNGTAVDNFFYLIKDRAITSGKPSTTTLVHSDLADLTSNCLQNSSCGTPPDLSYGWRVELTAGGEKNLATALTAAGNVFFTTFSPTPPTGSCALSEGTGRLYVVSVQDATAVINFDTSNDVGGTVLDRMDYLASGGIPVGVVPLGAGELLVQGQEAGQNIVNTGGLMSFKTYWHEIYQ